MLTHIHTNCSHTFYFFVKLQQDGEAQARRWVCNFIETSAKTNHNVNELFQGTYLLIHAYNTCYK